jgi:polygalacturonase
MSETSRRTFLASAALGTASVFAPLRTWAAPPKLPGGPIDFAAILRRILAPSFPKRDFPITVLGAKGDGKTDCRPAIQVAIDYCNVEGGGRVLVPAGAWLCNGPIVLKSNVELHLHHGARIEFSSHPEHYLPMVLTSWEGTELFNYSPFVRAYHAVNVAITGAGILDGNAKDSFAPWRAKQGPDQLALRKMGGDGVPVHDRRFGQGHFLRPPMLQFFGCRNVLVDGITVVDAPFWITHPIFCTNVIVRGTTFTSLNPNNDGVDPESCSDVLIENVRFETGDDSIAVKSGRDQDGWRVGAPTENVVIRRCKMDSLKGGLVIGSEMSGGVRNVFMEDCKLGKVERAFYFKSNLDRGGSVEKVWIRNTSIDEAQAMIRFTTAYHGYRGGNFPTRFSDITIENVACGKAGVAIDAVGTPAAPLRKVTLRNLAVQRAEQPNSIEHIQGWVLSNVRVSGAAVTLPSPVGQSGPASGAPAPARQGSSLMPPINERPGSPASTSGPRFQ